MTRTRGRFRMEGLSWGRGGGGTYYEERNWKRGTLVLFFVQYYCVESAETETVVVIAVTLIVYRLSFADLFEAGVKVTRDVRGYGLGRCCPLRVCGVEMRGGVCVCTIGCPCDGCHCTRHVVKFCNIS